jgi:hypothetical protein
LDLRRDDALFDPTAGEIERLLELGGVLFVGQRAIMIRSISGRVS